MCKCSMCSCMCSMCRMWMSRYIMCMGRMCKRRVSIRRCRFRMCRCSQCQTLLDQGNVCNQVCPWQLSLGSITHVSIDWICGIILIYTDDNFFTMSIIDSFFVEILRWESSGFRQRTIWWVVDQGLGWSTGLGDAINRQTVLHPILDCGELNKTGTKSH